MNAVQKAFRTHGLVASSGYISDGTKVDITFESVPKLDGSALAAAQDVIAGIDAVSPKAATVRERTGEFRSCFGIHRFSEPFRSIADDPVLLAFAATLVGCQVELYQSHLNVKQSRGGGHYSFHRDATYFHHRDGLDIERALGVAIALSPIDVLMGPLVTIIGSHQSYTPLGKPGGAEHDLRHDNDDDIGVVSRLTLDRELGPDHVFVSACGGDMVFFDPRCIHGSSQNVSVRSRSLLLLFFAPKSDFPTTVTDGNPFLHEVKL
ncbi:MAG TPA: phytanoyl-CoA dioxygenase family protein [Pirellulaceae bacterium]|jgi:ectoine hydroxylase